MFCVNCGAIIEEGNIFCTNCGTKVNGIDSQDNNKNEVEIIDFGILADSDNYKPVEWYVLKDEDDKKLLLSKNILWFNDYRTCVNNLNNIFDEAEEHIRLKLHQQYQIWVSDILYKKIIEQQIDYYLDGVKKTIKSKMFLLSIQDYHMYLENNKNISIGNIDESVNKSEEKHYLFGRDFDINKNIAPYWIIGNPKITGHAYYVTKNGDIFDNSDNNMYGFRPAIWIKK